MKKDNKGKRRLSTTEQQEFTKFKQLFCDELESAVGLNSKINDENTVGIMVALIMTAKKHRERKENVSSNAKVFRAANNIAKQAKKMAEAIKEMNELWPNNPYTKSFDFDDISNSPKDNLTAMTDYALFMSGLDEDEIAFYMKDDFDSELFLGQFVYMKFQKIFGERPYISYDAINESCYGPALEFARFIFDKAGWHRDDIKDNTIRSYINNGPKSESRKILDNPSGWLVEQSRKMP